MQTISDLSKVSDTTVGGAMSYITVQYRSRTVSADIYTQADGEDENGVDAEENQRVYRNGFSIGLHAPELQLLAVSRQLEQKARRQQYEQHHSNQYRRPVRHFLKIER